ncbi:MAG: uroporphyrinogen-III C-methyltransferase [Psychromonas sp.]|nr:uroporphyrinogen-III C-methyltransferase [Psychromonas sp.]
MSENKNDDAVTIEGETVTPEAAAVQSESPSLAKSSKSVKLAIFIAFFALLLIVASIAYGLYFYKQNKQLNDQQQASISQLNQQLSLQNKAQNNALAAQSELSTQVEQVNSELLQIKNASKVYQTDMRAMQRALAEAKVRHPNDWILSEVEYLVKLAGRKIWLERDIPSAVALLLAADQRVAELSDASLSVLRSALLEDINTLESLPKRDPDGLVLALSALERRIDKLLISGLTRPDAVAASDAQLSDDIHDWKKNLAKSWSDFVDSFIVINKRETKLEALLSPNQRWYLKENLRHDLAKAEFATYREQQEIYDIALHSAANLLENYYDLSDSATSHFYQSIKDLSQRKITVAYPDQLKSAPLLERIMAQRVKKSLASSRAAQE